jgi:hypothetical protein
MTRDRSALSWIALRISLVLAASALTACSGSNSSTTSPRVVLPTPSPRRDPSATGDPSDDDPGEASTPMKSIWVYYLGDGPPGAVLYRQRIYLQPGLERMDTAVSSLLAPPDHHFLRTAWKAGWLASVSTSGGRIAVDARGAPASLPAGMDERTAVESIQQVVYTLQAVTRTHQPVQFTRNGRPAGSVLGVPTRSPVSAAPVPQTMALMSIDDGTLGGTFLSRGPIPVTGLGDTAGGVVDVRLEQGGRVVRSWTGHAGDGSDPGSLHPWRVVVRTAGLPNGRYLVVASGPDVTDPSVTVHDARSLRLAGHHH